MLALKIILANHFALRQEVQKYTTLHLHAAIYISLYVWVCSTTHPPQHSISLPQPHFLTNKNVMPKFYSRHINDSDYKQINNISVKTKLSLWSLARILFIYSSQDFKLLPDPESPSSPRLAVPTKKTLPSSAANNACMPSCPVATCTIFGDLVIGSSAHFPGPGPPCLIPTADDLPVNST